LISQNSEPRQWDDKMLETLRKMVAKKIRIENELGRQMAELERRQTAYSIEIEMAVYLQDITILMKMSPQKQKALVNYLLKGVELSQDGIIFYPRFNIQPYKITRTRR
jgi:hypothetical protein